MTTIPSKTVERLQELYEEGGAFAKVCEDLAGRDRAYREWPVKRMCQRTGLARSEVVRVFKQFEELELGRFVVGRGGNQSRFVSDASMVNAARLAVGEDVEEASEEFAEESAWPASSEPFGCLESRSCIGILRAPVFLLNPNSPTPHPCTHVRGMACRSSLPFSVNSCTRGRRERRGQRGGQRGRG